MRSGKCTEKAPQKSVCPDEWKVNPLTTVIVPKSGGVTSTKAMVVRWLKREGDKVHRGEPLVELETEKVSFELESPAAGTLSKLFAKEAAEVPVGGALCEIVDSKPHAQKSRK
jgi:pyruvate/2-oxoglutarate dehydrogenase complex dihydrolipoamide acyltransferase (E2) component